VTTAPDQPPADPGAIAVALSYDLGGDALPRVVATGRGAVARAILELAFTAGVKVREDADLAQILAAVEVGEDIPVEAFVAVAEILNYVYRANGRLPDGEPPP
jgi:flagellar biosynthesis protein